MNEKELKDLLGNLNKLVPTLLVVGTKADGDGVVFMGSPEDDDEKRKIDLCATIAIAIQESKGLMDVIFPSVTLFMRENPKYRDLMRFMLKNMDETKHFADVSKMMDKTKKLNTSDNEKTRKIGGRETKAGHAQRWHTQN